MQINPLSLYTVAQTRELDRLAIEQESITGYTLMQRAAQSTFTQILLKWPDVKCMIVISGIGKNGGDGYLIAKLAHEHGMHVQVYQFTRFNAPKIDVCHFNIASR